MLIASLAPGFNTRLRMRGHEVNFQLDLQRAATELGVSFSILAPIDFDPAIAREVGDLIPCIPPAASAEAGVAALAGWLQKRGSAERAIVLLYEGATDWLQAVNEIAPEFPNHVFLVNLFHPEDGLTVPDGGADLLVQSKPLSVREAARRRADRRFAALDPRTNVRVLADTEERAFLAEAAGIRVRDVWPLHSRLTRSDAANRPAPTGVGPLRVLIPLAARQIDSRVLLDIGFIIRQVERVTKGAEHRWTIAGALDHRPRVEARMRKFETDTISVDGRELSPEGYEATFLEHDITWLPLRGFYNTQSSGKALDSLALGTPILAPANSFAAKEQRRWIAGAPAYEGAREAAELLLRLPVLLPSWRQALASNSSAMQAHYSAERAIEHLIKIAQSSDAVRKRPPSSPARRGPSETSEPGGTRLARNRIRLSEAADGFHALIAARRRR